MPEAIFDQARFDILVGDVGEGPSRVALGMFLADIAERLDRLGGAVTASQLAILAHTVRSSAAMFGFTRLSSLARRLEADVPDLPAAEISPRLDELRAALAAVRAAVA